MAFKLRGTGGNQDKLYFQLTAESAARGSRHFEYVTDDTAATFGGAGYISSASNDGALAVSQLSIGDLIWFWRVTTLDDDQSIEEDKGSGILDSKIYYVSDNDGSTVSLTISTFGGGNVGDMEASTYDPTTIAGDAFARANHTGTQLMATISDAGTLATGDDANDVGVDTYGSNITGTVQASLENLEDAIPSALYWTTTTASGAVHVPDEGTYVECTNATRTLLIFSSNQVVSDGEGGIAAKAAGAYTIVPESSALTINGASGLAGETNVTDAVWQNSSGANTEIASAGANLPSLSANDYFLVPSHPTNSNNAGWYIATGSPTTSLVAGTKLANADASTALTNPADAASGTVDIDTPALDANGNYLLLKSNTGFKLAAGDVEIFTGTNAQKSMDTSELVDIGGIQMADSVLSRPKIEDPSETHQVVSSSSGSATIDLESGQDILITLTENITTLTISNPPASGSAGAFTLEVVQGAGPYAITWPASVKWPGGTAPTLSAGSSEVDLFVFRTRDGGTTWLGMTAGQDFT